jgi:4-hydroxybenzoate polyprenyltransferase
MNEQKNQQFNLQMSGLKHFVADIKISHSVFALPFAAAGVLLAPLKAPSLLQCFYILLAMVSGRSSAMGANRYLDAVYDLKNVRTAHRAIPSGRLAPKEALSWTLGFGAIFVGVAFLLNWQTGVLSPLLLLVLYLYSYFKRFSWGSHFYLGFCLGLSPIAAHVALGAFPSAGILWLGAGILFWVAGFDLLYSLQDLGFDRSEGLFSFPVRFGVKATVIVSQICFFLSILIFLYSGTILGLSVIFRLGVAIMAAILIFEHWLIRDLDELGHSPGMGKAFFNANAAVSLVFIVSVVLDQWMYGV